MWARSVPATTGVADFLVSQGIFCGSSLSIVLVFKVDCGYMFPYVIIQIGMYVCVTHGFSVLVLDATQVFALVVVMLVS